ncbi:hypothetical protein P170DRAFT_265326 [Aspergillus steynii IBT 23096]|uniref:Uncharacterized protein n=1 Tax=Aspergillus steynii IBT 23096 TaxID=1392250 RepID=A0A2I2FVR2_9EURO|nr:uncharacterized protein P170DRAFT_265326 [Aspergillus steynii IBT 23096]PLB44704.1 hypothetical protein P170DRAFT_265326 [Aspergillus steynii IBT 23096]
MMRRKKKGCDTARLPIGRRRKKKGKRKERKRKVDRRKRRANRKKRRESEKERKGSGFPQAKKSGGSLLPDWGSLIACYLLVTKRIATPAALPPEETVTSAACNHAECGGGILIFLLSRSLSYAVPPVPPVLAEFLPRVYRTPSQG